ncbi:molybdopterin molybdotransferase MoeA [Xanthovirga aplysinae]|uniref:molybdopterin molybdotransferase MoeA n=1 Tax=Xanthovirga aplysinae TaxID=2529853 RepID=UPI0012BC1BC6|nr:gephyrin-like molybdotransferase Glp [Xanthovirga aplysinae]MTI33482.1 molybdopterin molybdenumtransferase MoeA [Xanthovirga aplysinae]
MVTVEKAKQLVFDAIKPLPPKRLKVVEALGYVLAEDIFSPINMPPFRQSAMDGYAIRFEDFTIDTQFFHLVGEIPAGSSNFPSLGSGEAVRVFTGAPVPDEATAVIIQEKAIQEDQRVRFKQNNIKEEQNIRGVGDQIKEGDLALKKGGLLNPAGIGFLHAMGITEVEVVAQPKVALIVSGDELVPAGEPLKHGQIYESNSSTLKAALEAARFSEIRVYYVKDDFQQTVDILGRAFLQNDVVMLSGGISVGKYDFIGKALEALKTEEVFYKVLQKPGKPLFFGKQPHAAVFALPGNPAASLTCFYEYVLPYLKGISGHLPSNCQLEKKWLPLSTTYQKKGDRAHFLKARIQGEKAKILEGQYSFILSSFAEANALIYIPAEKDMVTMGELVEVHVLPTL